ncbi:hypothetical protein HDV57DRAFT_254594 [Trichoderma longibrachiatum]
MTEHPSTSNDAVLVESTNEAGLPEGRGTSKQRKASKGEQKAENRTLMGFVKVPSPQSIPAQRTGATWDLALSLLHVRRLHTGRLWRPDSARVSLSLSLLPRPWASFRSLCCCAHHSRRDVGRLLLRSWIAGASAPGTSIAGFCCPSLDPVCRTKVRARCAASKPRGTRTRGSGTEAFRPNVDGDILAVSDILSAVGFHGRRWPSQRCMRSQDENELGHCSLAARCHRGRSKRISCCHAQSQVSTRILVW